MSQDGEVNQGFGVGLDEIGIWSEVKLEIIQKYAHAYSTILHAKKMFKYYYIDAFAGAGIHKSKTRNGFIEGSPLRALKVEPPFNHYYFVDFKRRKTSFLKELSAEYKNVTIEEGDANVVLPERVFPLVKYEEYRRALCLLDPYGLHLNWNVIEKAGKMGSIDIFLNFPVMDMNMNVLWKSRGKVAPRQAVRMSAFWGDDTWQDKVYDSESDLFGFAGKVDGAINVIVNSFRERLKEIAGFEYVPKPMPMKNSMNSIVYYLFFASQNKTGEKIAKEIFRKYGG